jgi:hypothetical protein
VDGLAIFVGRGVRLQVYGLAAEQAGYFRKLVDVHRTPPGGIESILDRKRKYILSNTDHHGIFP